MTTNPNPLTKPWSEAEDDQIRLYTAKGLPAKRCADALNRSKSAVIARAHRIGAVFENHRSSRIGPRRYG